jgi:hypothetical protein
VHPLEYNVALARAILEDLEQFLQSPEAFWPLTITFPTPGIPFPRQSLGVLLVTLDELRVMEQAADAEIRSASLGFEREFDRIRQKWPVAVERKALTEASQRLSLWSAYLQGLSDGREDPADYPQEVRQRVILSRLLGIAKTNPDSREPITIVEELDGMLRSQLTPAEFIWDDRLKAVYPDGEFWFLYGRIRT